MSAGTVPEGLKVITPYLQRASQLAEKEPIVSYYSNYYAAKLAIQKANKDNRVFIDSLLSTLEKQRKEIGENEAISNDLVGYAHIENFALKIFTRADDEDRQGQASQKTAKNYVAAANFLELLKVFGEIDSDTEEKIKYSKWRAAEIVKAIRDGRVPTPPQGAAGASQQDLNNATTASDNLGGVAGVVSPTFSSPLDPAAAAGSAANFMAPTNGVGNNGGGGGGGVTGGVMPPSSSHPTIANFPSPPLSNATPPIHHQLPFQHPSSAPQHTQFQDNNINHAFHQQQQQQPHPSTTLSAESPLIPSLAPAPPATLPGSAPPPPISPSPFAPSSHSPQPQQQQPFVPPSSQHQHQHQHQHQPPPPPMQPQFQPFPQSSPSPMQPPFIQPVAPSIGGGVAGPGAGAGATQQPLHQYQSPSPYQQPSPALGPAAPTAPMVLDPAVSTQVQKHCKWTISALTYDDVPTAIDNLEKALALLRNQ
ncbi:hypothetical protein DFQ27_001607 [Actinomortierella ambigua]|uniref:DUF605-domain-containing protein n=1 Tax=Actinomortierella ambigua TaxID=1343610 RepID=A0A9P6QBR7_9FUNG|nr:hypothetical protein DFQ27_001607 [Actinomortierella ambigua]